MIARTVMGAVLVLVGATCIFFGVFGWTRKRDVVDTSIVEVTVTDRETSPLLAALGGVVLVTGLVMIRSRRDRTPV